MRRIKLGLYALIGALLLAIAGCQELGALLPEQEQLSPVHASQRASYWLAQADEVAGYTPHEAAQQLRGLKVRLDVERFRYGLLLQQTGQRDGWVQARDTFRQLATDESLRKDLRYLARAFLDYNQAMINWHERHRNLQKELAANILEKEQLEQKIDALTHLEEDISSRKEQHKEQRSQGQENGR